MIEQVLDHKRASEEDDEEVPTSLLYLVRWRGLSHIHNTWEEHAYLKTVKGAKKLDNYVKRLLEEQAWRQSDDVSKEELEQRAINLEMHRQTLEDHKVVERVVAQRQSDAGTPEYFVVWKWLGYDEATWEEADAILPDAQPAIDAFQERLASTATLPHKSKTYPRGAHRSFKRMQTQPAYLTGGELRDYQLTGLNWLAYTWAHDQNGILADEMVSFGMFHQSINKKLT